MWFVNCGTDHVFIGCILLIFTKGIFRSCASVFAVVIVVQVVDEMWAMHALGSRYHFKLYPAFAEESDGQWMIQGSDSVAQIIGQGWWLPPVIDATPLAITVAENVKIWIMLTITGVNYNISELSIAKLLTFWVLDADNKLISWVNFPSWVVNVKEQNIGKPSQLNI